VLLALPQLSPQYYSAEQAIALDLSAAPAWLKDGRGQQCTTEFPSAGFAAQTKEERKTKGSDEKEAVGNELLGNAFLGNDAERSYKEAGRGTTHP